MKKVKNLIVGCGLSGAVLAERIASQLGEDVLIIDKRDHIGGNCYDYKDKNTNITVHQYGPHIFHTNEQSVWDYLSQFTKWHLFFYRVKAIIDGKEVDLPFNLDSLLQVFPSSLALRLEEKLLTRFAFNARIPILELSQTDDADLQFLAQYIYKKVFLGYTIKQWGVRPEDLDKSVSARVPVLISRDNRYFQDLYCAIPQEGYGQMIKNILRHPKITVKLNTDFQTIKNEVDFERLFWTGAIDEYFNYQLGALPYRSLKFSFETYHKPYFQSGPQINYPNDYDFTRIVEYKYYLDEQSDSTIISKEYPVDFKDGENERYYPIENKENKALFEQYKNLSQSLENVYFLGRLGDYKYYNMDQTVKRALDLFSELK